jgi:hypothetical protein
MGMESGRGKRRKGPLSIDSKSEVDIDVDANRRGCGSHCGPRLGAHSVTKMKIESVDTGACRGEKI